MTIEAYRTHLLALRLRLAEVRNLNALIVVVCQGPQQTNAPQLLAPVNHFQGEHTAHSEEHDVSQQLHHSTHKVFFTLKKET